MKEFKDPFFSIIVPSYNQAEFLKENLDSITNQSFSDWEAIIMDGGSTDKSVAYIKAFAKKNKGKVWWQSKNDGGQVLAINSGLKRARGKVVSYLNSDDKYLKNTLKTVYKVFEGNSTDWIFGGCKVTIKSLDWTFWYKSLWPVDIYSELIYLLNPINQPSVFLRRTFAKRIGAFDNNFKLAFDYEYWIRCIKISKPVRVRMTLSAFRVHKGAKGSQSFSAQFEEELKALRKHKIRDWRYLFHKTHNLFVVFVYRLLK